MEFVSVDDVDVVVRQTDYTNEQAAKKLNEYNNDTLQVIKNYLEIETKKDKQESTNQKRMSNMRKLMNSTKEMDVTMVKKD